MEEFIRLRRQIDGLYQVVREFVSLDTEKILFHSNETIEAFQSLRLAGSWTSEILKIMNAPAHQKVDTSGWKSKMGWEPKTRLQKITLVREKVDELLDSITPEWSHNIDSYIKGDKEKASYFIICLSKLHEHLIEAKFNLGYEIDRINGH